MVDCNCFETNCIAQQLGWRMLWLVGCSYSATAYDGRGDRDGGRNFHLEDQEKSDPVAGCKNSAKLEPAVHMAVRLSRIGYPDHFVESRCSLELYRYSIVQEGLEL